MKKKIIEIGFFSLLATPLIIFWSSIFLFLIGNMIGLGDSPVVVSYEKLIKAVIHPGWRTDPFIWLIMADTQVMLFSAIYWISKNNK